MTFTKVNEIPGVRYDLALAGNQLFFISTDLKLQVIDLDQQWKLTELIVDVNAFRVNGNRVIASTNDQQSHVYDIESHEPVFSQADMSVLMTAFIDNCQFIYQKISGQSLYRVDWCNKKEELIMAGKFDYFSKLVGNILVSSRPGAFRKYILGYHIADRSLAWEYDLGEIGRYYSRLDKTWSEGFAYYVIVANNKVFILTQPKLICIDAVTGKELWILDVIPDNLKKLVVPEQGTELLLFDLSNFYFIDIESGVVTRQTEDFIDVARANGIISTVSTYPSIIENKIYITLSSTAVLFVLDTQKMEVTDVIDLKIDSSIAQGDFTMIYKDLLLQRSSDDVMHIYKRNLE